MDIAFLLGWVECYVAACLSSSLMPLPTKGQGDLSDVTRIGVNGQWHLFSQGQSGKGVPGTCASALSEAERDIKAKTLDRRVFYA